MEYSVTIIIESDQPVTDALLELVASIGGVASVEAGTRRVTTTLTIEEPSPATAIEGAIETVARSVTGYVIAAEVLTVDEADRRLALPAFPELVGITAIAERLGVSRQRAKHSRPTTTSPHPSPTDALAPSGAPTTSAAARPGNAAPAARRAPRRPPPPPGR